MADNTQREHESTSLDLPKPKAQVHLNHIDGLRALAALYVVLYHAASFHLRLPIGWLGRMTSWLMYGHFAVDVFIVVSGFSLMLPVVCGDGNLRGGYWGFMKRRARRILPPYYFALLYAIILALTIIKQGAGTAWGLSLPITETALITHLFLVHDVFGQNMYLINSPLWSIAVEWHLYFFFPLIPLSCSRFGGLRTALAAIAIGYGGTIALRHTQASAMTPHYLSLFTFGALGAAISFSEQPEWKRLRQSLPWKPTLVLSLVIVVTLCHLYKGFLIVQTHAGLVDFFVGLSAMCFLVMTSSPDKNTARSLLSWPPLVFIGTFSYSLYLVHDPLLQVMWQYIFLPLHLPFLTVFIAMILVSCPISVAFAYLFFLAFEKPFLNTRPKPPIYKEPLAVEPPIVAS